MRISIVLLFIVSGWSCQRTGINEPETPFPEPGGRYEVGTESFFLTYQPDDSLNEQVRNLYIQVWYPIEHENSSYAPYLLDSAFVTALKEDQYLNLSNEVLDAWRSLLTYARLKPHSAFSGERFPLVIFSHGFGMSKLNYSCLSIEIASHGYVVASIDHPGSGFTLMPDGKAVGLTPNPHGPDGKVVEFCEDISCTISEIFKSEELGNHIQKGPVGAIGHSLGGAAGLNLGQYDERVKASINLDGYLFGEAMKSGVKTPFLSILQRPQFGQEEVSDSMKNERRMEWKGIMDRSEGPSYVVNVKGLMHYDFSDLPFIIPDSIRTKNGGVLEAVRSHQILSALIVPFFDMYLKNDSTILFEHIISQFDEVNSELE